MKTDAIERCLHFLCSARFTIDTLMNDPRKDILSKVPTKALLGIFGDLADPQLGCSVAFFALGMTAEFRETQPRDMLRLVFEELQSRMPNVPDQATASNKISK